MTKGHKRRVKPKTLLLSTDSDKSIARLMAALAFTSPEVVPSHMLRSRAVSLIDILRRMT